MRNERARPQQCWKSGANGPTLLRYALAITEQKKCWELLAEKLDRFQTLRNNTQQHPTTCNRVCKRTQPVTSNIVESCWPTMLRPFARGFIERFHSRGQHLRKFIGTKESVCIRKEFNSHRIGLGHQHGRRFIVLGHQYGRRDVIAW